MRIVLTAALFGGIIGAASAANFDSRLYISPSVGYVMADPGRGVDNDIGAALTVGLPMSAAQNYEIDLSFQDLGGTSVYSLNAGVLNYFSPEHPYLFGLLRAGVLATDGQVGSDYFSPNLVLGLGAMLPGWGGKFRLEGLLRGDLHYDEGAGLGGKKAFVEPIIQLGYTIPLGPEPQIESPAVESVDVVAPTSADGDGDGVTDAADLCPGTPPGTVVDGTGCAIRATSKAPAPAQPAGCREPVLDEAVDEHGCAVERAVILNDVNFEFDSDILTDKATSTLDDVAQVLKGMPGAVVEIAGHTSDEGDEYYNIDLSQRRAAAVRSYLVTAGVDRTRLKAKGYGDSLPITENKTYAGRRKNRRVEVKVIQ